jgi:hypothetical protein
MQSSRTKGYIGCTEERRNEQHTYESDIGQYDITLLIKLLGRARVKMDNLEDHGGDFLFAKALPVNEGAKPTCHDVFTNRQHGMFDISPCILFLTNSKGPTGQRWNGQKSLCYSVHLIDGALQFGHLISLTCNVVYEIYKPVLEEGTGRPFVPFFAIVSYGEHTHPAPPPSKIPNDVRLRLMDAIRAFGVNRATASRLLASSMLPRLLNNATTLAEEHISLLNHDRLNKIMQRERIRKYPWGTDFIGKIIPVCLSTIGFPLGASCDGR